MKVLLTNYGYCLYPEGMNSVEEFVNFANENFYKYIPLRRFVTDNCVPPYFIREEMETVYANMSLNGLIKEENVTVLSRDEYDARLLEIVESKCIYCTNYTEDMVGDNLKGHREHLSLNGDCYLFEEI